jgi:hypothetical protein
MSTKEMQIPRVAVGKPNVRRVGWIMVVVAALAAGGYVGRSTAPTERSQADIRPTTALSSLGVSSVGDERRAEMHKAMDGILADTTPISTSHVGPKAEEPSAYLRYVQMHRARNWLLPQQR